MEAANTGRYFSGRSGAIPGLSGPQTLAEAFTCFIKASKSDSAPGNFASRLRRASPTTYPSATRVCPLDGAIFLAYVEQVLAPTLGPDDIVICDNLSCHKVDGVSKAIEARGASVRYLPPYSPDLNPIEMAFSKLKAGMRKLAARDFERLCAAAGKVLSTFTASDSRGYFRHAHYATI